MGAAMLHLSSTGEMLGALERASRIDAEAYTIGGAALAALEAAAERGAHVTVELEGRPYSDRNGRFAAKNRRVVDELRAAGVDARLGDRVHAKVICADGTFYFDDKNWGAHDLVLRDDDAADASTIPMRKHEALAAEARLLRESRAGDAVAVASESFGRYNSVYSALRDFARRGGSPRLIVDARELRGNAREWAALRALATDGVRIRVADDSEKLAVAGERAWIGSANATVAFGTSDLPDWGVDTRDPTIVRAISDRIESEWSHARDFRASS